VTPASSSTSSRSPPTGSRRAGSRSPPAALTAAAGAFGQLLTTAPLAAALTGVGWTPTFAASGILTAILAILAVNRLKDRPDTTAGPGEPHEAIVPALKRAWSAPATRHGLWVHFALMAPFVTLTGLWAFPYLVEDQHLGRGTAATLLAAAVLAFGVSAPLLGTLAGRRPHRRGPLTAATAALIAAALATLLAWPGDHPPTVLIAGVLCLTGMGGAAAMLGFDIAREGGGSASGMVNLGGFGAAIVAQSAIGLLVAAHLDYRVALTPLAILAVWGAVQATRHASLPLQWSSSRA
jgi:predicted MFS family arabinose efflux permease